MTERTANDPPEYDGAAYTIDVARRRADRDEWTDVADLAHESIERVQYTDYPHLFDDLHRQATDVVLRLKREDPDHERVRERLEEMQVTVEEMQALATSGRSMLPSD
ncbi:hypothetical protein [Halomarina ordinaria]|uniref:Uncharacterized protein n=1 Tax=Halomarina ordinaria TaxID=3033939 RepID=A0ABD5U8S3_9EURY|nr:hypothetical protein [Halomarina sp. PSRA2]